MSIGDSRRGLVGVATEPHRVVVLISVWVDDVMRSVLYSIHDN